MNNRAEVMSFLQYSILTTTPLYVPHLVFMDRQGVIRSDFPGESQFMTNAGPNIRSELDKLVAASPAAGSTRTHPVKSKK